VVVVVSTHNTRAKPFLIPDQFFHATLHARSYLGAIVKNDPIQQIFDAASIYVGGFVFLCATSYGVVHIIAEAHTKQADNPSGN
jgi:hypothetical protein